MHISNELAQSIFPLDVRLCLYPLIGITHHSDQEINKHHHRHQHVNAEGELEKDGRPFRLYDPFCLELFVCRLTEDGEEQQLDRVYGIHLDCKYALNNVSRKVLRIYARGRMQKFSATAQNMLNVATTKRRKEDRFQAIQDIHMLRLVRTSQFCLSLEKVQSA